MRAVVLFLALLFVCVASREAAALRPRQIPGLPVGGGGGGGGGGQDDGGQPPDTVTSDTSTTTTTTSTTSTSSTTTTTSSSSSTTTTSSKATSTSTSASDTTTTGPTTPATTTETSTSVIQVTPTADTTSSPSTTPPSDKDNDGTPVSTGTIIGLSVAGGIAVIGIAAFIVWKVTRKRFSDFEANGEEIKWPELNNETHALPARPTGRAGVDDDAFDDASVAAARDQNVYGRAPSVAGTSVADLPYNDPYAVPPLPHMNPNQPYRDDPSTQGAFYDPYRGPIPQSLHDPPGADGAESIPLSTYSASPGGRFTPQTYSSYDGSISPDPNGRRSPGPAMAYSGRQSPGPNYAYRQ